MTAPNQVNLSSTGLRLALPAPATCPKCGEPAHGGDCATGSDDWDQGAAASGGTAGPAAGATGQGSTIGGGSTAPGGEEAPAEDKQVAFSFTSNLSASADSADGFAALFRTFYVTLDERQISYLQGTIQMVLQAEAADQIQQRLTDLGITPSVKDI